MPPSPPIVKVCGITREADAADLLAAGVRWLGINLYEPSPRSVSLARAQELFASIPAGQRVLVDVAPDTRKLQACKAAGFDRFQIHFKLDELPAGTLQAWTNCLGAENLWLAPKLPPGTAFPTELLAYADTLLLDAYAKEAFGGTGKTGNWEMFRECKTTHPDKNWILAGGLAPHNLQEAIRATGTEFVDLNSGFETTPGIKDTALVAATLSHISHGTT